MENASAVEVKTEDSESGDTDHPQNTILSDKERDKETERFVPKGSQNFN